VFRSPVSALQGFVESGAAARFPILGDPERVAYKAYGVGNSLLAVLNASGLKRYREAKRSGFRPRIADMIRDGVFGIVADFLIDAEGIVAGVRYGTSFSDSLTPERALAWARDLVDLS